LGLPKTLAITLGGLVAVGAVIYIFRNNLVSGAKSVGSTIGESVGGLFGSIPSGIVSGGTSGLTGGVDQKTLEQTGNSTGKLGFDWDTAFKNLNDNVSGLFHLGDKEYFQTVHAETPQKNPYQDDRDYANKFLKTQSYSKNYQGITKQQAKEIPLSEFKQGGKYQIGNGTDPSTFFKGVFNVTYKNNYNQNLPLSQQAVDYYKKLGVTTKQVF
jgi:hypothetical protein